MRSYGKWECIIREDDCYSPRWGHSINVIDDYAYIYGGFDGMYKEDLWIIDLKKQFSISKIKAKSSLTLQGLLQRSLHSSIVYKSSLIIYGGMINVDSNILCYEPLKYNTISNKWSVISTNNLFKINRANHSASLIRNDYMFIFGGEECLTLNNSKGLTPLLLNLKTMHWSKVTFANKDQYLNRNFHSASVNAKGDKVYIYGGYSTNYDCLNNLLIFHFDDLSLLDSHEEIITIHLTVISFVSYEKYPFPRWGASINLFNDSSLLLFGGRNKVDFNDLWLYDIEISKWFQCISFYELPIPRRKHISFVYKNILIVSGGYNGSFLSDINVLNLSSIINYHSQEEEILNYINNPFNCDLLLLNNKTEFNCHKILFFSHIPEEDIIVSDIIHHLSTNPSSELSDRLLFDLTEAKSTDSSVLKFIELLYLGHFSSYITCNDLGNIIKLMSYFHLTKAIQVLFQKIIVNNILFDFSNILNLNMIELISKHIPPKQLMNISYDENSIILKRNSITFESTKYQKLFLRLIYFKFPKSFVPKKIASLINYFIVNHSLPLFVNSVDDMCLLIEALFYGDFFCYNSFYNQLEKTIIILINCNHTLSRRFLLIIAVYSYYTNGKILYAFLIDKILKEYSTSLKKCQWLLLRLLLKDKEAYDGMIERISKLYHESKLFLTIVNKHSVSDFTGVYRKPIFPEIKQVRKLIAKLSCANIYFNIPKMNLIWKRTKCFKRTFNKSRTRCLTFHI